MPQHPVYRAFIERHLAEADKRDETKAKRVAQAIEWMSEGKPRNRKYMK